MTEFLLDLHPSLGDIDIIAAVGDSLTSATAANSAALWEVLVENRGLSWCIGGLLQTAQNANLSRTSFFYSKELHSFSKKNQYSNPFFVKKNDKIHVETYFSFCIFTLEKKDSLQRNNTKSL